MPFTDWPGTTRAVTDALTSLGEGEGLVLGEPGGPGGVFVQVLRTDDLLTAECVAPGWAALGALGWLEGPSVPHLRQCADRHQGTDLALLLVATLRVLGASPALLELETGTAVRTRTA